MKAFRAVRGSVVVAAAAGVLALSGCGTANTAAIVNGVRISEREREILTVLAAARGDTVSREALGASGESANERTIDVQINRLRRKIERDPAEPLLLQTVRGMGYRLVVDL